MEINTATSTHNTQVIQFPTVIDMKLANLAQEKATLAMRENAARKYSEDVAKRKRLYAIDSDDIGCFISGLSLCATIVAMWIVCSAFL